MVYTERGAYHGLTEYQDNMYTSDSLVCKTTKSKFRSNTKAKCVHYLLKMSIKRQEMIKADNIHT